MDKNKLITRYKYLQINRLSLHKPLTTLMVLFYMLHLTGCWYSAISRYYVSDAPYGHVHEWDFSVKLTAFYLADKKQFQKEYGRSPEEYNDYDLWVNFWTITKIDTSLSEDERHEIRVDSVHVSFENYSRSFLVQNSFQDNLRKKAKSGGLTLSYLDAHTKIKVATIYVPPHIQTVDVRVYGMLRSLKDGLEPFDFAVLLKRVEKTEKISKYD